MPAAARTGKVCAGWPGRAGAHASQLSLFCTHARQRAARNWRDQPVQRLGDCTVTWEDGHDSGRCRSTPIWFLGTTAIQWESDAETRTCMDKGFWQAIVDTDFAVPNGESLPALTRELVALLGSTDAELRDTYAYPILCAWLHRGEYSPDEMRSLVAQLAENL